LVSFHKRLHCRIFLPLDSRVNGLMNLILSSKYCKYISK